MLRKRTITFSEGFSMLGCDDNGSNSAWKSSPNEDSHDSSDDFSAHKQSTSKKMVQNMFYVYMAPERRLKVT